MRTRLFRTANEIASNVHAAASIPDSALLTPSEAEVFLATEGYPLARTTLKNYRVTKPSLIPFVRQGRAVNYRAGDLRKFAHGARA